MPRRSSKPFTKAQATTLLRSWRLGEAWGRSEPIEVDGIIFDLRCKIDAELWRPAAALGTYGHRAALFGPKIIFPWTPKEWRTSLSEGGEAISAARGCAIRVAKIVADPLPTAFQELDPPEARQRKLAYIWVETPNGDLHLADRPLVLVAQTATALHIRAGDYDAAFRSLVAKLERQTGINDLEEMVDEPIEAWRKPNAPLTQAYGDAFMALTAAVKDFDEHAHAAFGYMMARAEAELELMPEATRGLQARAIQAKASGARRANSAKARENLQRHAAEIINDEPNISLGRCAKLVADRVIMDPDWRFKSGEKWIGEHIKPLFELRANGREYQPRRLRTRV